MTTPRRVLYLLVFVSMAMLARGTTWTTIDVPGATHTHVYGINSSGDLVGEYGDRHSTHGFLLRGDTFTTIDVPGASQTWVAGINDLGQVAGWAKINGIFSTFFFDGVTFAILNYPGAERTEGLAINNAGQIVGLYEEPGSVHGFGWSSGTFTNLDVPNSGWTAVTGIDNQGRAFGTTSSPNGQEFDIFVRSPQGDVHIIDVGTNVITAGVNDHKVIVGSASEGFKFDIGTKKLVTVMFPHAESHTTICQGINNSGVIVGYYRHKKVTHGFVRTPK